MKRSEVLQEVRKMRFEESYEGWKHGRLTQEEAATLLGVCDRTFRRYLLRYEDDGMQGLRDKRLGQMSHRLPPVDEVMALTDLYGNRYLGFNVKHFYSWYRRANKGSRSYTWVKKKLLENGLVSKTTLKGEHRKRRPRAPYSGHIFIPQGVREHFLLN